MLTGQTLEPILELLSLLGHSVKLFLLLSLLGFSLFGFSFFLFSFGVRRLLQVVSVRFPFLLLAVPGLPWPFAFLFRVEVLRRNLKAVGESLPRGEQYLASNQ
jgi:hypothetical protein